MIFLLFSLVLLSIYGCNHYNNEREMDRAEHLMQSHPDSSLAILNGISEKNVHGEQALARYSLLKSIALDRNYIDTTNFNILQPAIDYY